ncbi:hypothetical protein ACOJBO_25745 [Rhizobium beringeri]
MERQPKGIHFAFNRALPSAPENQRILRALPILQKHYQVKAARGFEAPLRVREILPGSADCLLAVSDDCVYEKIEPPEIDIDIGDVTSSSRALNADTYTSSTTVSSAGADRTTSGMGVFLDPTGLLKGFRRPKVGMKPKLCNLPTNLQTVETYRALVVSAKARLFSTA